MTVHALRELANVPEDDDATFEIGELVPITNPLILPAPDSGTVKHWYKCVVAGGVDTARFEESGYSASVKPR